MKTGIEMDRCRQAAHGVPARRVVPRQDPASCRQSRSRSHNSLLCAFHHRAQVARQGRAAARGCIIRYYAPFVAHRLLGRAGQQLVAALFLTMGSPLWRTLACDGKSNPADGCTNARAGLAKGASPTECGGISFERLAFGKTQHFPNLDRWNGPQLDFRCFEI